MDHVTRPEALSRGVTDAVLRGPRWQRLSHGLYLPGSATPGWLERLRHLRAVLPEGAAFSGLTAARVYGWWLPPLPEDLPVFVTVRAGGSRLTRRDLKVRRANLTDDDVRQLRGVPVTSPVRTLLDLAQVLSVLDLVVVADAALKRRHVTLAELRTVSHIERRGIRTYRRMTELADAKSESAWETMLRLLHVLCGIAVEVQPDIFDAAGGWIARSDLRIKGTKRLPEYDGGSHRDPDRHRYDLQRDKLLSRAGYERYGYIAREICTQPEMIIGDAEDALGWPVDLERLDGWLSEFNRSLFARGGVTRWAARWC